MAGQANSNSEEIVEGISNSGDSHENHTSAWWPRSFEYSMNLYGQRGRVSARPSRESFSVDASREVSPNNSDFFLSFKYRGGDKPILAPLLSESNLVGLAQREEAEIRRQRNTETEFIREKNNSSERQEDDFVHLSAHSTGQIGANFTETCFNCVNVLIGVGILSTPYATSQGGWISLSLLVFFAFVFCNTAMFLKDCIESRPYISNYPDIGQAAFGHWGRWVVAILLYLELFSVSVDLLVLEGDNLSHMFPNANMNFGWISLSSSQSMLIFTAIVIFPTVCLRDLSFMAYLSICGVAASILVVFSVIFVGFSDGSAFSHSGQPFKLSGFPVAVGVFSFCFSGHTIIPNIYCSMKKPEQFSKVLGVSFFITVLLYGGIAAVGYSMYGENLESQITLNLPKSSLASIIAVWTTIVNPLTKFALMITPLALGIEELYPVAEGQQIPWSVAIAVRIMIVSSMVLVALAVPFFGYIMAFIGSCLGITMSVIMPSACFLKLAENRKTPLKTVICILYIFFGAVVAAIGTYASISRIIGSFDDPTHQ